MRYCTSHAVARLLVTFLVVSLCSVANGEPSEGGVHILVSQFGDRDQLGIPVAEIVQDWLEDVYSDYDFITVDLLDRSFRLDDDGLYDAVSAGDAVGGDIVFFGSCLGEGDRIRVAMASVIATDCPSIYQMVEMIFIEENSFTSAEMTPGSEAPYKFKFYAYLILGDWMSRMGRYEEAADLLDFATLYAEGAYEDDLYITYCFKGQVNHLLERYWSAISAFSYALKINCEDPSILSARSVCYNAVGNFDYAIEDLLVAVELDPEHAFYYAQLGGQLKQMGRMSEALFYLDRSVELDPDNAMTFRDRSRVYYGLLDHEPALADIDRAIEIDPDNPQGHAMRGNILFGMGDPTEALESFNVSVELETDVLVRAWSLLGRANCYLAREEYQLALEDLAETLESDSTFYTVYYYMGLCNIELGNTDLAVENLTEFLIRPLLLTPVDPWTREGMLEEAEELLENL